MAQVVQTDDGQPRVLGQRLEVSGGVLGSQRAAVLAREHEPSLIPRRPPRCALEVLRLLLSAEHQDGFGVEVENAISAFGLGCADHAAPIDVGDLLVDGQGRAVEVEILPAQADALPSICRRWPLLARPYSSRIPKWCSSACRHRAWELTRAAASGHAAIQVVDRVVEVDRLVTVVQEVPVPTAPKGAEWPAALAQLATALDTGRVYDRDLPALAQALADVADALDRRPGWRLRTR